MTSSCAVLTSAAYVQDAVPGALDGSLELLLPLMEGDLFGDIADAKEAAAFAANYRGTRSAPTRTPVSTVSLTRSPVVRAMHICCPLTIGIVGHAGDRV